MELKDYSDALRGELAAITRFANEEVARAGQMLAEALDSSVQLALLGGIPGLLLTEIPNGAVCCGSAGIYNLVQPGPARELGERKADAVASTGARLLIAANPGCTLQITAALADRGQVLPVAHLAEVLDASLRGVPVGRLLGSQAR